MDAVKGEWRYHDVKIIEVDGKSKDGSANRTYSYEPKAKGPDFDDSGLGGHHARDAQERPRQRPDLLLLVPHQGDHPARGRGQVGLLPDHGRRLRRGLGRRQAPSQAGRYGRARSRPASTSPIALELKDARPGKVFQIAIFGINGPISDTPTNWIFLGPTFLELVDKK